MGKVEKDLRRVCEPLGYSVNYIQTKDNILSSKRVAVKASQSRGDIMVLGFMGNLMLSKDRAFSSGDMMHLVNAEFLDSTEISSLIDDLCRLIGTLSQLHKERIILLTPFPRHFRNCCGISSHKLPSSSRFPNLLTYLDCLSYYVARHPKLRVFTQLDIVSHREVFGPTFSEGWLVDGVHLSERGNNLLVSFLSSVVAKKFQKLPPFSDACLSFDRWATLTKDLDLEDWNTLQDIEQDEAFEGPPADPNSPPQPTATSTPVIVRAQSRQSQTLGVEKNVQAVKKGHHTVPMSEKSLMSADTLMLHPEDTFTDSDDDAPARKTGSPSNTI